MEMLFGSLMELTAVDWLKMAVMWVIGGILIFLAIKKNMEPSLLLPMGFGAILVNLPFSGALDQVFNGIAQEGPISVLFRAGIDNELFPLLLFIGIGAMIDFGPLISNPKMFLLGAAAQFGIFFTFGLVLLFPEEIFSFRDAASISIIGAADGPTSIFVAKYFDSKYIGSIVVAAYSYMALVPIVQPPVIRLCTTKKERLIRMKYEPAAVSKTTKILFPIIITVIAGMICRSNSCVVVKCLVTHACVCSCTHYPCIVVAEDTCVFFVSARICGNFAVFYDVVCECRVVKNKTVLCTEIFLNACHCLFCVFLAADVGHYAEALRFDEDLAFFVFL